MTTDDRLDAILGELRKTNLLLTALIAARDREHALSRQARWQLGHENAIAEIEYLVAQRMTT